MRIGFKNVPGAFSKEGAPGKGGGLVKQLPRRIVPSEALTLGGQAAPAKTFW